MSIEDSIKNLTAAITDQTAAIRTLNEFMVRTKLAELPASEPKVSKAETKPEAKTGKAETKKGDKSAPKDPEVVAEPAYSLEDVKTAARDYSNKYGREAALDLLGKFGVKVSKDLPEKDWAAFIAATQEEPAEEADAGEDI